MDIDKLIAFVNKLGLMPAGLMWLAYEMHRLVDRIVTAQESILAVQNAIATNQQQALYLMQRLIDLHK